MTSANGLEIVHFIGNDTNIRGCRCARGESERERMKIIFCPKKCPKRNVYFIGGLMVMEMLEIRRCAGMWVYRRKVASFKR